MAADPIDVDVVEIGDSLFDKNNITPNEYFDYVKSKSGQYTKEELNKVIDTALTMIDKTKITGQTDMAKQIAHEVDLTLRQYKAVESGFDIYVSRKDIEVFIEKVEGKAVKIVELKNYTRDIPDDKLDAISKANEIFDQLYVVFTDYTKQDTKKVARERRQKDPVVFGAFIDSNEKIAYLEDSLFFICDWIDEQCDLTLEQIVRSVAELENGKIITHRINIPDDEDKIKEYLKDFHKKKDATEDEIDDVYNIADFIKEKEDAKKKVKATSLTKKKPGRPKKSTEEKAEKKPRGRKKKSEE